MLTDAGSEEPVYPYHSWNTTTTFQKLSVSYSNRSPVPATLTV